MFKDPGFWGTRDQRRTQIVSHAQNETVRGRKEVHKREGIDIAPIPSLRELESMTEEQRCALVNESTAALARNFEDIAAREVLALLNDHAVRKWLSTDHPSRRRRVSSRTKSGPASITCEGVNDVTRAPYRYRRGTKGD
jgi:hypothetical protein